jgi:hypothetical protein
MAEKVSTFNPALLLAMQNAAPLNLEKVESLADQFDAKVKSIIAKAIREGIPYQKLERVRKDGKPVASKEVTVCKIESRLGLADKSLDGLEKASKIALERLFEALSA